MSTPDSDDLERRLTELFGQRAATVTQVRQFDTGPAGEHRKATGSGPGRDRRRWQHLGVLAAAAAVFVAVAATIVAIQASRPQPAPPLGTPTATPTSSNTSCSAETPASWRQAITAGAFSVHAPLNAVISANGGTGDFLAIQGHQPADVSSQIYSGLQVVLYHGTQGSVIYTAQGSKDFVQADPTAAISADWVAFAVAYPRGAEYGYQVMLYQRRTGTLRTLAGEPGQPNPAHKLVMRAPVIAAGKVYWLAWLDNRSETTTLESWDLSRNEAAGSVAVPGFTALVGYGSGVAVYHDSGQLENYPGLSNGAGTPLPKAQLAATAGGGNFGFDGTAKVSWLRYEGNLVGYASLVVGGTGVSYEPLIRQFPGIRPAIFPFTDGTPDGTQPGVMSSALLDLRTSTAVLLPAGTSLEAVVGDRVVFGTGRHNLGSAVGAAGLSLVPLSALPPAHC